MASNIFWEKEAENIIGLHLTTCIVNYCIVTCYVEIFYTFMNKNELGLIFMIFNESNVKNVPFTESSINGSVFTFDSHKPHPPSHRFIILSGDWSNIGL